MWQDFQHADVRHASSPAETERFGFTVGRLTVGNDIDHASMGMASAESVAVRVRDATEELLVVRYPAWAVPLGGVVAESGRRTVPAGTLTYWEAATDSLRVEREVLAAEGLALHSGAIDGVVDAVDEVVTDSFRGYANHYRATSRIDPEVALAGYREWAQRSVTAGDDMVVILSQRSRPVGVATLALSDDGNDLEILLAGMTAASQGHGWYRHVVAGVGEAARRVGAGRVIISTQAHNTRVQRAWARIGMRPFGAIETCHALI